MDSEVRTRRDFLKAAGLCASGVVLSGSAALITPASAQTTATGIETPWRRPNILWVICESASPCLGCYGDPFAVTPNLDRFAGQGIVYTKAYATASVCSPALSSLMTGMYATSLGTQHMRSEIGLPKQIEPLPKLMRIAGYYCSSNAREDYNFKDATLWDDSSPAAHWRNRAAGQPFFSVVRLACTDGSQIEGSDREFSKKCGSKLAASERHAPDSLIVPPYYPDTPEVRKLVARYYDLMTCMDKQVGELLGQLERDSLSQSTIVFFFADHGMGLPRFRGTLYDSGLRVPLIVRVPAAYEKTSALVPGGRTSELVSFVDFAPTMLALAGVSIPSSMQGRAFLGEGPKSASDCIWAACDRIDETYETSRCLHDSRYKYIRHFMPHLPYAQPNDQCDRSAMMQELRRAARDGQLVGIEEPFWEPTKPLEELYDTQLDPHEVRNLAGSAEHRETLERMRRHLRDWMLQTHDTGLLPEGRMHALAAGATPYEVAQDALKYPEVRVLCAAELVGAGSRTLPALMEYLEDADAAVRYWAVTGLDALGPGAAEATEALKKALEDPSPDVRIAAAGALCRLGSSDQAVLVLARGLQDSSEPVVLHAARTLQGIGDKAKPVLRQVESARLQCRNVVGGYKNDTYAVAIERALTHVVENCK
jgi:N-sulfoglucosamine sulfohydrolase